MAAPSLLPTEKIQKKISGKDARNEIKSSKTWDAKASRLASFNLIAFPDNLSKPLVLLLAPYFLSSALLQRPCSIFKKNSNYILTKYYSTFQEYQINPFSIQGSDFRLWPKLLFVRYALEHFKLG